MLAIGGVRSNTRYLLIVRGLSDMAGEVENMIQEPLKGKARLCVKNQGRESMEYIYELSEKQVKIWQDGKVSQKLLEQKGVMEVNLVGQNDEISA